MLPRCWLSRKSWWLGHNQNRSPSYLFTGIPAVIELEDLSDQDPADRERDEMAKTAKRKPSAAFMKPMKPSAQLAEIVGDKPLPRTEVTKKVWAHIKRHKLQNPKNKREILADEKLQPIFGAKKLNMFEMTKAVNKHLK